jgi:hypothetical protein
MGRDYQYLVLSKESYDELVANGMKRITEGKEHYFTYENYELPAYIDKDGNYNGSHNETTDLYAFHNKCEWLEGVFSYQALQEMAQENLNDKKYMDVAALCIILAEMDETSYAFISNT